MGAIFDTSMLLERVAKEPVQWNNAGQPVRQYFIGSVFSLLPSGKYYTPWAWGNLATCPACGGTGQQYRHSRRVRKRALRRAIRLMRMFRTRPKKWAKMVKARTRADTIAKGLICSRCDGFGSHDVADDGRWYAQAELELAAVKLRLAAGEGDPCDLFVEQLVDEDWW